MFPLAELDYTYYADGSVNAISDSEGGLTEYQYDPLGRLTHLQQSGTGVAEKRVDFAYNDAGQPTSITRYADLEGTELVATTTYPALTGYDGMGRLTSLEHAFGATTRTYSWQYDAASRITQMVSPDGTDNFTLDDTSQLLTASLNDEDHQYDANGNRTSTGYATGAGNRLLADGTYWYSYDAEGNRTERFVWTDSDEDGVIDESEKSHITAYTWDQRNRLLLRTPRFARFMHA